VDEAAAAVSGSEKPDWYREAEGEMGVHEMLPNGMPNPRVHSYFQATTYKGGTAAEAWCSAFACWCMERSGIMSPRSAAARSWLDWGTPLLSPQPGCVVVYRRGARSSGQGHVHFWTSDDSANRSDKLPKYITGLGGNQHNQVCIATYSASDLLGYRWPATTVG
jgi:uncharacterized protein (TIGR02594 family)